MAINEVRELHRSDRPRGELFRITLDDVNGTRKVNVRGWYKKDGVGGWFAGKGITLTEAEFKALQSVKLNKTDFEGGSAGAAASPGREL